MVEEWLGRSRGYLDETSASKRKKKPYVPFVYTSRLNAAQGDFQNRSQLDIVSGVTVQTFTKQENLLRSVSYFTLVLPNRYIRPYEFFQNEFGQTSLIKRVNNRPSVCM